MLYFRKGAIIRNIQRLALFYIVELLLRRLVPCAGYKTAYYHVKPLIYVNDNRTERKITCTQALCPINIKDEQGNPSL